MVQQTQTVVYQTFLRHYGDFGGKISCVCSSNPLAPELNSKYPLNNPKLYWIEAVPMMLAFVPPLEITDPQLPPGIPEDRRKNP